MQRQASLHPGVGKSRHRSKDFTPGDEGRKVGVPIYFECSLNSSRIFYEHLGFKTLCMVRVGKGEVDENGFKVPKGKDGKVDKEKAVGVKLWAVIWWPDGCWPEGVEYWDGMTETEVK